jgi:hypothetical protein
MTIDQTPPAVWIDGDPLMEAIAAAVWERCERSDSGLVIDDPRNIAAAAVAAVSSVGQAPATDHTALREQIAEALMRWAERGNDPQYASIRRPSVVRENAYSRADAVIAVLPELADRAAVRCSSCEHEAQYHDADGRCWFTVEQGVPERDAVCSCQLRRMAVEAAVPGRTTDETRADTLAAWLYQRFMPDGEGWNNLDDDQRAYWEHQARAVRRAVERGGFKPAPAVGGAQQPTEADRG